LLAVVSTTSNAAARENNDSWKNERQYPPLVFNSNACCGLFDLFQRERRQVMNTTSGGIHVVIDHAFRLKRAKLQVIGQSG